MSPIEKEIALAFAGVQIKEMKEATFGNSMIALITLTHQACGQVVNHVDMNATIGELCSDLVKYNGILTHEELKIAFKNGYQGKYGDYFGLNNRTYFSWVSAYRYGKDRANAKIAERKAIDSSEKKPELTEEEKKVLVRKGAIDCFNSYKDSKVLFDTGNINYQFLVDSGIIDLPLKTKQEIAEKVKQRMANEKSEDIKRTKGVEKDRLKRELQQVVEGKFPSLVTEARREALKMFFDNLIELGDSLENII